GMPGSNSAAPRRRGADPRHAADAVTAPRRGRQPLPVATLERPDVDPGSNLRLRGRDRVAVRGDADAVVRVQIVGHAGPLARWIKGVHGSRFTVHGSKGSRFKGFTVQRVHGSKGSGSGI